LNTSATDDGFNQNSLSLLHVNIRSLNFNFNDLLELIHSITLKPDVVCVSETRIKENPVCNISIPGYEFLHVDSPTNAGGVAMYVSTNYKFEINKNIKLNLPECEDLWINLKLSENEKVTIEVIYRHPKNRVNVNTFDDKLCSTLSILASQQKHFNVLGDMNINIDYNRRTAVTSNYINELINCCAIPIITIPTRVTSETSSIIDHILTNDISHITTPGVIETDLVSDHYPIFCSVSRLCTKTNSHTTSFRRDNTNFNPDLFRNELEENLNEFMTKYIINNLDDTTFDTHFSSCISVIESTIDKHASHKRLTRKEKKL